MARGMELKLSRSGMVAALSSAGAAAATRAAAEAVASGVPAYPVHSDGPADTVVASHSAKFSAASSVTIAHPAGQAIEAKYGLLSKAASGAGLTVTR